MLEFTRQVKGMAKKLDAIADTADVLQWAQAHEGIAFTVVARVDGTLHMQLEGVATDTVYPELGKWVVFDGSRFFVMTDDEVAALGIAEN